MEDKHFETEMNQQMEGFSLQPSVEVWKKVELQIRKEKRRRRFIFWWLPLLLIGTGSAVYFMYPYLQNSNETISVDKRSNDQATVTTEKKKEKDPQPLTETKPVDIKTNDHPVKKPVVLQQSMPLKVETKTNTPEQSLFTKSKGKIQTNQTVTTTISTKQDKPVVAEQKTEATVEVNTETEPIPVVEKKTDGKVSIATQEPKKEQIQPSAEVSTATVPIEPTAQQIHPVKKQPLETAVVFRSGISGISQFKAGSAADSFNTTTGNPASPTARPSAIKTGVGFSVGLQFKKSISNRSSLSTGLAYSFYSATHQTGSVIYASAQFNNNVSVSSVNRYAASGNSNNYRSRYHFIEIPLLYHLQLNNSAKRPFNMNAGIAYNYLIGSNAFYFNQASGNYYYDRQLFNRSQWQQRSGLSVGLIKKLNYPLQAGIQYQYSLSGQWKKSLDLNQHLSFTGVQLLWRLNKK